MNLANLHMDYEYRDRIEKKALAVICACYYYDLADTIDSMTDEEIEIIIFNDGIACDLCYDD